LRVLIYLISIMIIAASIAFAVYYNSEADQAVQALEHERYSRMMAEEGLEKAKGTITSLETEMGRINTKIKSTKVMLEQATSTNKDLKVRLDRAEQSKDELRLRIQSLQNELKRRETATAPSAPVVN
jgi:peptidoglycan hydrolase CwlO-like protein